MKTQYMVHRKYTTAIGVELAVEPTAPRSKGGYRWRLVSVALIGNSVFFWWERRVPKKFELPKNDWPVFKQ